MNLTTPRRSQEIAQQLVNSIRRGMIEYSDAGYDHEQAMMLAVGRELGRHGLAVSYAAKLLDLLDRDSDRRIAELDELLRQRRQNL
jgi:hypothetical protein